jgi:CheY-like chemotaxis protein
VFEVNNHGLRTGGGQPLEPRPILLGENDDVLARLMKDLFEDAGYSVERFHTGPEIIEQIMKHHPDVVLLNRVLPALNGDVVAAMLKDILGLRMVPLILYDGSGLHLERRQFPGVTRFVESTTALEVLRVVQTLPLKKWNPAVSSGFQQG